MENFDYLFYGDIPIRFEISLPGSEELNKFFEKLTNSGFIFINDEFSKEVLKGDDITLILHHQTHGYFNLYFDFYKLEAHLSKLSEDFDPVISEYAKKAEERCIKKNDLTTEEIIYNSVNKNSEIIKKETPFIDLVGGEKLNFHSSKRIFFNRKGKDELYKYHNQKLMDELNEFMISVKIHLHNIEQGKHNHPMPSINDIDKITNKLIEKLREDKTLLVKK